MSQDKIRQIARLTPEAYKDLETRLGQEPFVNAATTAHHAGFQLGIQYVLKKLRTGFVIGA